MAVEESLGFTNETAGSVPLGDVAVEPGVLHVLLRARRWS